MKKIAMLLARFLRLWGDKGLFKWVWAVLCGEYEKNRNQPENQMNNFMTLHSV